MTKTKKFLFLAYLFVLFHTVKDFFRDFLETDFLYFFDANEDPYSLNRLFLPFAQWGLPHEALAKWGRVVLVLSNEAAVWVGVGLIIATPFVLKKHLPLTFFSIPASKVPVSSSTNPPESPPPRLPNENHLPKYSPINPLYPRRGRPSG